mgnify:CR=1 FL=1
MKNKINLLLLFVIGIIISDYLKIYIFDILPLDYLIMILSFPFFLYLIISNRFQFNSIDVLLFVFVILSILTVFWSDSRFQTVKYSIRFVLLLTLYFTGKIIVRNFAVNKLLRIIVILNTFFILTSSLIIFIFDIQIYSRFMFVSTISTDPNFSAYILVYSFISSLYLLYHEKKVIYIATSIILFVFAIFTWSRSILIAIILMLVLLILLNYKSIRASLNSYKKYVLIFTFMISIVFFTNIGALIEIFRLEYILDLSGRTIIWSQIIEIFSENPFFGIGMDSFRFSFPIIYEGVLKHYSAHNTFLEILVGGGLFVLIPYIFFLLLLFKKTINSILQSRVTNNNFLQQVFSIDYLFYLLLLLSFLTMITLNLETSRLLWLLFGMISFERQDYYTNEE